MDKPTRWLRVEVSKGLYDEIVRLAKLDDREPHVYLRRHLESHFAPYFADMPGPKALRGLFEKEAEKRGLTGESVHGLPAGPDNDLGVPQAQPTVCLNENQGVGLKVLCPCSRCSTTC